MSVRIDKWRIRAFAAGLLGIALLGAAAPSPPVSQAVVMADGPAPKLSDYGFFVDAGARHPNARVTPYALNTPLFSDYAEKSRYVYVPLGTKAHYRAEGALDLPVGAALIKTFAYPADFRRPDENVRFIETRVLIHKPQGWTAQAYVWNAGQTEAVLKRAGARMDVDFVDATGQPRRVDYAVPNQNQCKECHQLDKAIAPIGPKARNLNGDFAYAEGAENQLVHWTRLGLLAGAPKPTAAPRTPRWDDPAEPLDGRARAYLDGNCAHCHNARGVASNSGLFLDLEEQNPVTWGVGKHPVAAGRGSGDLKDDIVPGRPDDSIVVYRMASTEPGVMMPELGRSLTHDEGLALIRAWIRAMPAKAPAHN